MSNGDLDRLGRAQLTVSQAGLSAVLVCPGPDLRYLTGYNALALERLTCLVVSATDIPRLIVPLLEEPAAMAAPGISQVEIVAWREGEDPFRLLASLVDDTGVLAVDDRMWAVRVFALRAAMPRVELVTAGGVLSGLRVQKSPDELRALREAGAAMDLVQAQVPGFIRVGCSERAVAAHIRDAMFHSGFDTVDFVSVASGPNGASPHHMVSDRAVERGDGVTVDLGGMMPSGYYADSTRVYVAGRAPAQLAAAYVALKAAQQAACAAVRPGAIAGDVDAAARQPLTEAGYGDYFVHRTGHGIGLEMHEEPFIAPGSAQELLPGMVFSVEPGIYVPGCFGARIEDIVACIETGSERLNQRPRALLDVLE